MGTRWFDRLDDLLSGAIDQVVVVALELNANTMGQRFV